MPTPAERKALVFVAALAALGVAARGYRAARVMEPAATRAALDGQIAAVDSAVAAAAASRVSKGGSAGRNRGRTKSAVSPALPPAIRPVAPEVTPPLSGLEQAEARRLEVERSNAEARARAAARTAEILQGRTAQVTLTPPVPSGAAARAEAHAEAHGPVDLDTAPASDIATVPGIGATLAKRIVADRAEHGAFGSLVGLQRVKGIGPAMAAKIGRFVTFSRPLSSPSTVIRFRPRRPRTHRP